MANINRSAVIQRAVNELGLQTSKDIIPTQTLDKVQVVYDLSGKEANVVRQSSITASSAQATMYTTGIGTDFYLTGAYISIVKDATCDIATGNITINVTQGGQARTILAISVLTLTAQNSNISISFPTPIKVDRNTAILRSAITFSAGAAASSIGINGFESSSL